MNFPLYPHNGDYQEEWPTRDRYPQVDHERNKNPTPFVWTKSAGEILENLAAYCR
jgi:hypothetical protein